MVCLTKRRGQGRHQQTPRRKVFDTWITKDLLEVTLDPTYQPRSDDNSDSHTFKLGNLNGMSIGLMVTHSIHNLQQNIYRRGLNTKQAEFAVKIYKSHQQCRLTTTTSVELLLNWLRCRSNTELVLPNVVTPLSKYGNSDCRRSKFTFQTDPLNEHQNFNNLMR